MFACFKLDLLCGQSRPVLPCAGVHCFKGCNLFAINQDIKCAGTGLRGNTCREVIFARCPNVDTVFRPSACVTVTKIFATILVGCSFCLYSLRPQDIFCCFEGGICTDVYSDRICNLVVEGVDFHDKIHEPFRTSQQFVSSNKAFFKCIFQCLRRTSGHFHIVARLQLKRMVGVISPVGFNQTFIAPFSTQNVCQELFAFRCFDTIDEIVRGHDCPRISLFYSNFKTLEINFAKRTFAHSGITAGAVCLFIVRRKMLQRDGDTFGLAACCERCSHLACEQRIFGIVLKVTPAERISVDIHTGREPNVNSIIMCFYRSCLTDFFHKIHIPSASLQRTDRPCGAVDADADTLRAIRCHDIRNPVFHQVAHTTGVRNACIRLTAHHIDKLFIRNLRKEVVHRCASLIDIQEHNLFGRVRIAYIGGESTCTHRSGCRSCIRLIESDIVDIRIFVGLAAPKRYNIIALFQCYCNRSNILEIVPLAFSVAVAGLRDGKDVVFYDSIAHFDTYIPVKAFASICHIEHQVVIASLFNVQIIGNPVARVIHICKTCSILTVDSEGFFSDRSIRSTSRVIVVLRFDLRRYC